MNQKYLRDIKWNLETFKNAPIKTLIQYPRKRFHSVRRRIQASQFNLFNPRSVQHLKHYTNRYTEMKARPGNCKSRAIFWIDSHNFSWFSQPSSILLVSRQSDASRKIARLLHIPTFSRVLHLAPLYKRNAARKITEIPPRSYVSRLHIIRTIFQAEKKKEVSAE